jgi:hypothetical protein
MCPSDTWPDLLFSVDVAKAFLKTTPLIRGFSANISEGPLCKYI